MIHTGEKIPFFVAKILTLFVDAKKVGTWMRIKWLTNGKKDGFLQTYRDIRYRDSDTRREHVTHACWKFLKSCFDSLDSQRWADVQGRTEAFADQGF